MTPDDKNIVSQIENLLYAPNASTTPDNCKDNLAKAQTLMATITSDDGRKNAQYYIDDFNSQCKKSKFDWMTFAKSPIGLGIIGLIIFLVFIKAR